MEKKITYKNHLGRVEILHPRQLGNDLEKKSVEALNVIENVLRTHSYQKKAQEVHNHILKKQKDQLNQLRGEF